MAERKTTKWNVAFNLNLRTSKRVSSNDTQMWQSLSCGFESRCGQNIFLANSPLKNIYLIILLWTLYLVQVWVVLRINCIVDLWGGWTLHSNEKLLKELTFKAISNFSNNCSFPKSRLLAMNQDKNFNSFLRSEAKNSWGLVKIFVEKKLLFRFISRWKAKVWKDKKLKTAPPFFNEPHFFLAPGRGSD